MSKGRLRRKQRQLRRVAQGLPDDYRLSLQLRVKRLLRRNEEAIQINTEDTAGHKQHMDQHIELVKQTLNRTVWQFTICHCATLTNRKAELDRTAVQEHLTSANE